MFERFKFNQRQRKITKAYAADIRKAHAQKDYDKVGALESDEQWEQQLLDAEIAQWETTRFCTDARQLYIQIPAGSNREAWVDNFPFGDRRVLSYEHRTALAKAIQDAKALRSERRFRIAGVVAQIFVAAGSLAGAITGVVLAWKRH